MRLQMIFWLKTRSYGWCHTSISVILVFFYLTPYLMSIRWSRFPPWKSDRITRKQKGALKTWTFWEVARNGDITSTIILVQQNKMGFPKSPAISNIGQKSNPDMISQLSLPTVQVPLSAFQPHHGGNYLYAVVCAVTVVCFVSQVCPSAWTARHSLATAEKTEGQSSTGWKGKSLSKNSRDTLKKVKSGKDASDASVVHGDWKYKVNIKHKYI